MPTCWHTARQKAADSSCVDMIWIFCTQSQFLFEHHFHAVVNAIAHIHVKASRLTKQGLVAGGAAAIPVAGGLLLGIRLRFHHHTPQQLATFLALHQQAADELGGDQLGGAGEEGLGEGWESVVAMRVASNLIHYSKITIKVMMNKVMKNIKLGLEGITPPYAVKAARKLLYSVCARKGKTADLLFDGDDQKFKQLATQAKVYFEYGCGQSTIWCSFNTQVEIFSVDTSARWAQDTMSKSCSQNMPHIKWVDCGVIGKWGRPTDYSLRENFKEYILGPFMLTNNSPDLILIDGRFRVACFLNSLLRSTPGTRIIFDDYTVRPQYHVVEEFCQKPYLCGHQAIFTVPHVASREPIKQEIEKFSYVMD